MKVKGDEKFLRDLEESLESARSHWMLNYRSSLIKAAFYLVNILVVTSLVFALTGSYLAWMVGVPAALSFLVTYLLTIKRDEMVVVYNEEDTNVGVIVDASLFIGNKVLNLASSILVSKMDKEDEDRPSIDILKEVSVEAVKKIHDLRREVKEVVRKVLPRARLVTTLIKNDVDVAASVVPNCILMKVKDLIDFGAIEEEEFEEVRE